MKKADSMLYGVEKSKFKIWEMYDKIYYVD